MTRLLPALLCLFLSACATPTALMQTKIDQVNAAWQKKVKADEAVSGKEADLNRAALYATQSGDVKSAALILDSQLTLTGPAPTSEAVLRQQLADLQHDKHDLLANVSTLQSNAAAAQHNLSGLKNQIEVLAIKDAAAATQEQEDNSWGGLSGLFRYLKKSTLTLLYVAIGLVALIIALRFSSIWFPEVALVLTGLEHLAAAGCHALVAIVGPGVLDAAGWIETELHTALTSSPTAKPITPTLAPPIPS